MESKATYAVGQQDFKVLRELDSISEIGGVGNFKRIARWIMLDSA